MNLLQDERILARLGPRQRGVFSLDDLKVCLDEPHRSALYRRVESLIEVGALRRFSNGFYVAAEYDLAVLSKRLAPDSAVSFETVLARELVIGPRPAHAVSAIRGGRSTRFESLGARVQFHHLTTSLRFGERTVDGVRMTDAEKALLDVFTFHLRGRRALFDLQGDIDLGALDRKRLRGYLQRYLNPRLVAFVRKSLRLP